MLAYRAGLLLVCLPLSPAVAQDASLDIEGMRPAIDAKGMMVTEGASTLRHLELGVSAWWNYGTNPVKSVGNDRLAIIEERAQSEIQVALGLGDGFALGLSAPLLLWQRGVDPSHIADPTQESDLTSAGLGDVRASAKVSIQDIVRRKTPVGGSILGQAIFPTGSPRSLIGEGGVGGRVALALEASDTFVGSDDYRFRVLVNGSRVFRPADQLETLSFDDYWSFAAATSVRPVRWVELGVELFGQVAGDMPSQRPLELAPMLAFHPTPDSAIRLGGGFGLTEGIGAPERRITIGATISPSYNPRVRDRDKDGIVDRRDMCIWVPEDLDGVQDLDGCPEEDVDSDGILDAVDECPTVPEDLDGWEDEDGCPDLDNDDDGISDAADQCPMEPEDVDGFMDDDGCPDVDNDGDGINDSLDECPLAPETMNGIDDEDGCPDEATDTDGDGLLDAVDTCPNAAEDYDGFEDEDGCPDLDNDDDGIDDTADLCPLDPETVNDFEDEDGCPDLVLPSVIITDREIKVDTPIFFAFNADVILEESQPVMDDVAQVLLDNPEVLLVRVVGHTSSEGDAGYNLRLSEQRARAVVRALMLRGVEARRLEYAGAGESEPIASNDDARGREQNRRVEFRILERKRRP